MIRGIVVNNEPLAAATGDRPCDKCYGERHDKCGAVMTRRNKSQPNQRIMCWFTLT